MKVLRQLRDRAQTRCVTYQVQRLVLGAFQEPEQRFGLAARRAQVQAENSQRAVAARVRADFVVTVLWRIGRVARPGRSERRPGRAAAELSGPPPANVHPSSARA